MQIMNAESLMPNPQAEMQELVAHFEKVWNQPSDWSPPQLRTTFECSTDVAVTLICTYVVSFFL